MKSAYPVAALLRSIDTLAGLAEEEVERLVPHFRMQEWTARSTIAYQDECADAVHFLTSGFAKIERRKGGLHLTAALIGPGEVFGALAVLRGEPRWASLVTLTPCTVLSMAADSFHDAMQLNAAFAYALAKHFAGRLLKANRQLELLRGPIGPRIEVLRQEWRALGVPDSVRLSNSEIARMLGCRREVVSRAMRKPGVRTPPSADRRVAG